MGSKSAGRGSSKRAAEALTPQAAVDRIAASKLARRRELARLPFAEKFRIVVELYRIAGQVRPKPSRQG